VQSNRHALAGKRWYDADLIAQTEQTLRLVRILRMEKPVGDLEDGQRAFETRERTLQPLGQMRALAHDAIEKGAPAFADLLKALPGHDEAQIGDIVLDHLEPGITA
jgi:hypothetical protein